MKTFKLLKILYKFIMEKILSLYFQYIYNFQHIVQRGDILW